MSVALELINDPSILFVDEPTSGLDSKTAHDVLRLLGGLARKGKIVICTVHQPSFFSFSIFDELLLLHQGAVCYFGSLRGAVPYFQAIGYPGMNLCTRALYARTEYACMYT